jgi:hypothetical protein
LRIAFRQPSSIPPQAPPLRGDAQNRRTRKAGGSCVFDLDALHLATTERIPVLQYIAMLDEIAGKAGNLV